MYRAIPEFNRICVTASRDRAYQQHLTALRNIHSSIDTRKPKTPQTIGLNYKRYENEQQRARTVSSENSRLDYKMKRLQKQEHFPLSRPQKPYTLRGQTQKDEMYRITHENKKILHAIETGKPTLRLSEWRHHNIDHKYQVQKMSIFRKTVPINDIIEEEYRTTFSRPPSKFSPNKTASSQQKEQVDLTDDQKDMAGALLDSESVEEEEIAEKKPADLTDHQDNVAASLLDSESDSQPDGAKQPGNNESGPPKGADLTENQDKVAAALLDSDSEGFEEADTEAEKMEEAQTNANTNEDEDDEERRKKLQLGNEMQNAAGGLFDSDSD